MHHILSAGQFTKDELLELFERTSHWEKNAEYTHLRGNVLGTIFLEPSTRTRLSTEAAMLRLGGKCISVNGAEGLSLAKGESISDTVRTVSQYVDIIAIRHKLPHIMKDLANVSDVPLINCGDGSNSHPTQAIIDLYTIWKNNNKKIDRLNVFLFGDNEHARTSKSLRTLLKLFDVKVRLLENSFRYAETTSELGLNLPSQQSFNDKKSKFSDYIQEADVVYVTRNQMERWGETGLKNAMLSLNKKALNHLKKSAIILHPLPRTSELSCNIDDDPRVKIWEQAQNGMFVRMTLIEKLLTG